MFHTIILVGNLGRDPEMRYTPTGQAVTSFNVATNRQGQNADGSPFKETIWFRVSVWGKSAENCNQYLRKGSRVLIEGRLVPDQTTGGPRIWKRNDGTPAASFELRASTVRFLTARGEDETYAATEEATSPETDQEDIPF